MDAALCIGRVQQFFKTSSDPRYRARQARFRRNRAQFQLHIDKRMCVGSGRELHLNEVPGPFIKKIHRRFCRSPDCEMQNLPLDHFNVPYMPFQPSR
jgi:hypothetical protein